MPSNQKRSYFLQVHKYQNALLDKGLYTLFTLIIVHGKGPAKLSPDLQSALGWSSKLVSLTSF